MARLALIIGYEGRYLISEDGSVFSKYPEGNRPLKQQIASGYPCISLRDPETKKKRLLRVHSLVARHFVPGYRPGLEVNHKNGVKTDNRAENLEWVTPKENMAHARASGLRDRHGLSGVPVIAVNLETGKETCFKSMADAAIALGTYKSLISNCCLGKRKAAANHAFRFQDPTRRKL